MSELLKISDVRKSFTMHLRSGVEIPVIENVNFVLNAGECSVLGGPSGIGKSSILKMIYGNYGVDAGQVSVAHKDVSVDLATAEPRQVIDVRKYTIGYVSQFLRTIPRVTALDIVAGPLMATSSDTGITLDQARTKSAEMLALLNLPQELWDLPPATFSGGEQQRVNIAAGFITDHPILLLDEPTASLDAANRQIVIEMIAKKKSQGVALLGIFHDADVRDAVADNIIDVTQFTARKVA